jgi:hypothetical protein
MRNFDETTVTDAVLRRIRAAKDDRVSEALVRHLHAFVREIEPTQAEWEAGIDFLTRTGQMCDDNRQEFILLSDTLGVSMLVDAINHRTPEGATETTVLGPPAYGPEWEDHGDCRAVLQVLDRIGDKWTVMVVGALSKGRCASMPSCASSTACRTVC